MAENNKHMPGPCKIWPTHWGGGSSAWYPNRIRLESDATGETVAYVEHHGAGDRDSKYPTGQDYANAHVLSRAFTMLALLEEALPIVEVEAEASQRECLPPNWPDMEAYCSEMCDLADKIAAEIAKARGEAK
jgi:hypothetical protein